LVGRIGDKQLAEDCITQLDEQRSYQHQGCSTQVMVKPSLSVGNISSDTISFFMRVVSATTEVIPIATISRVRGVPVRKIVANVSHNIAAKLKLKEGSRQGFLNPQCLAISSK